MTLFKVEIKRWVALIVCVCFMASLFPEAQAAIPSLQMAVKSETPRILNIDIPTELASVDEWYQAPATSKPKLIVHIQDAHSNYEAQTNIRDVIRYLNTNYGFKTILVEGAASELDPNILKLFPDQERNLKLVDELAKIGEVTGAEMFLVENSAAAKGVGIEKPELYRKNFDALQKVYSEDTFVSGFFDAYEKKLGQIASRSFGPRLIQALAEWRKFETGHREFLPFVSKLADLSKKVLELDLGVLYSQIEWPQLTRLLVLQKVEEQLSRANRTKPIADSHDEKGSELSAVSSGLTLKQQAELEKQQIIDLLKAAKASEGLILALERFNEKTANLNRIGASEVRQESAPRALIEALVEKGSKVGLNIRDYPAFAKYAGYLILRSEIVPGALFEEIKKLFDRLLETLVKEAPSSAKENSGDEAARKRLLLLHRDEMLARKLLRLELSHDEWLAVLSRQERFYPDDLNRRMLEQLGENTRTSEADPKKVERLKKLNESFRAAFTFYSAAINRETYFFQRMQETLATTDKAILITGGFHAEGMKDLMRKYDINYGTLTPRITKEFSNDLYRKVMMTGMEEDETNDQRLPTPDKAEPPRGLPQASPEVSKPGAKDSKKSKSPEQKKSAKENYLVAPARLEPDGKSREIMVPLAFTDRQAGNLNAVAMKIAPTFSRNNAGHEASNQVLTAQRTDEELVTASQSAEEPRSTKVQTKGRSELRFNVPLLMAIGAFTLFAAFVVQKQAAGPGKQTVSFNDVLAQRVAYENERVSFSQLPADQQAKISAIMDELIKLVGVKDKALFELIKDGEWKKVFNVTKTDQSGHGGKGFARRGIDGKSDITIDGGTLEWGLSGDAGGHYLLIRTTLHEFMHWKHFVLEIDHGENEENKTRDETADVFGDSYKTFNDAEGRPLFVYSWYLVKDSAGKVQWTQDEAGNNVPAFYVNAYQNELPDKLINQLEITELRESLEAANHDWGVEYVEAIEARIAWLEKQSRSEARLPPILENIVNIKKSATREFSEWWHGKQRISRTTHGIHSVIGVSGSIVAGSLAIAAFSAQMLSALLAPALIVFLFFLIYSGFSLEKLIKRERNASVGIPLTASKISGERDIELAAAVPVAVEEQPATFESQQEKVGLLKKVNSKDGDLPQAWLALAEMAGDEAQIERALEELKGIQLIELKDAELKNRIIVKRAQLIYVIQMFKLKKEKLTPDKKRAAIARVVLPPGIINQLKEIKFGELPIDSAKSEKLSFADAVSLFVTFGIVSDKLSPQEKAANLLNLAGVVATKSSLNAEQFVAIKEMMVSFFPEMVADSPARLAPFIKGSDVDVDEQIRILQMQAIFNPNLTMAIYVVGGGLIPKQGLSDKFTIHHVDSFEKGLELLRSKDGIGSTSDGNQTLVVIPNSLKKTDEMSEFKNMSTGGFQFVSQIKDGHNKILAGAAMVLGAQNLYASSTVVPDGISRANNKVWVINKESLGAITELLQKLQTALVVMQSA